MLAKVYSFAIKGIEGVIIEIEVNITSKNSPKVVIVGLADASIRESRMRIQVAMKNSGYHFPYRRVLISLAPANIRKCGSLYDLPIAIALMVASEQIPEQNITDTAFIGELALDGTLRPTKGIIAMIEAAYNNNIQKVIVPFENAEEAAITGMVEVYPVRNLKEAVAFCCQTEKREAFVYKAQKEKKQIAIDYSEVSGQEHVKRAMMISAAGFHHCLMIGSPGSGKTMLASRLTTILPELSRKKAIETSRIHSINGSLKNYGNFITCPPFRSPHHTISNAGMAGGGSSPKPGELSLAHNGILFLDELGEFQRATLEVMRQPLENRIITIARAKETVSYPCEFLLISAMNPCPCGYLGDRIKKCDCTYIDILRYRKRISGPLLDRFDIQIEVPRVEYKDLVANKKGVSSSLMKKQVLQAREIQRERFDTYGIETNSQMNPKHIKEFCFLEDSSHHILKKAIEKLGISARAYHKILKVARTIADLEASPDINDIHISEAIQYRSLDRMIGK